MSTSVWIIEDEESVGRHLEQSLREARFDVRWGQSLKEIENFLQDRSPDILILDRLLNGVDSASAIPELKQKLHKTQILVLSAIGGPLEKSRILDSGADEYMSKPFSVEELLSRLRLLLRRPQAQTDMLVKLGNVTLSPLNQTVEVDGSRVELSRKEFQLLSLLMQHPLRIFSRQLLLEKVWEIRNDVESNVVEVTIKNVRKKLEGGRANVRILSKRFLGYWIET